MEIQLNAKRMAFVEHYLRCKNATEAAKRAGYSKRTARSQGQRLLTFVDIQARIAARLAEMKWETNEVLTRLGQQARGEHTQYLQADGTIDLTTLIADGNAHLVKATRWDRQGHLIIEFYDAQTALLNIGKHLGMFVDKLEVRGSLNVTPDDAAEAVELVRQYRERMKANDDTRADS